jgi:hypothetical protein
MAALNTNCEEALLIDLTTPYDDTYTVTSSSETTTVVLHPPMDFSTLADETAVLAPMTGSTIRRPVKGMPYLRNLYSADQQYPCKPCLKVISHRGYCSDDLPLSPGCHCRTTRPIGFIGDLAFYFANNMRAYYTWPRNGTPISKTMEKPKYTSSRLPPDTQAVPTHITREIASRFDNIDWVINVFTPIRMAAERNHLGLIIRHIPALRHAYFHNADIPKDIRDILQTRGIGNTEVAINLFLHDLQDVADTPEEAITDDNGSTVRAYRERRRQLLQEPVPPHNRRSNIF